MRRLTLFISVALALLAVVLPATAGAKSHKRHHHARLADRNHNGMPDRWEHKFRVHKAKADPDRDGVTNIGEFHNEPKFGPETLVGISNVSLGFQPVRWLSK